MAASEAQGSKFDTLYRASVGLHFHEPITIKEYNVVNETAKSYMAVYVSPKGYTTDPTRFSKEDEGEVKLDVFYGSLHGATIYAYETTREEFEEFVVPRLIAEVSQWLTEKRDYYDELLKKLEKQD